MDDNRLAAELELLSVLFEDAFSTAGKQERQAMDIVCRVLKNRAAVLRMLATVGKD